MLSSCLGFDFLPQGSSFSFYLCLTLGLLFGPQRILLVQSRLVSALCWRLGRRRFRLCCWLFRASFLLPSCCRTAAPKDLWKAERALIFRFCAVLDSFCHALCQSLEVLQTLPENIETVDVQPLFAADAPDKHPDSENLTQNLALSIGMAHLLLRIPEELVPILL